MFAKCLALLCLLVLCAPLARARDGDMCTNKHYDNAGVLDAGPTCAITSGVRTQFLCDSQTHSGTDSDGCTIIGAILEDASFCVVELLEEQPTCDTGTMTIQETSASESIAAADASWTTLGTITGATSPEISQTDPFRPAGPRIRATFADITDTDCTRVSVVLKCFY